MKVRYSLPIRSKLRVCDQSPVQFEGWRFHLNTADDPGYVNQIVIEILNVPKERWPTIREASAARRRAHSGNPLFPFQENENAFRFSEIQSHVINLESYLSVFGLEEIEFSRLEEEWIPEADDEFAPMRSGWSSIPGEFNGPTDPLTHDEIARCIVASNRLVTETAALAYFRIGQSHMWNRRYVEAIRNLYMSIEYLFANGKHTKHATLQEFQNSKRFSDTVSDLFLSNHHDSFEKIKSKHSELKSASGPVGFFKFLFRLRGELQHASPRNKWHPSRQNEFEHEAICIMNLAETICFEMVIDHIQSASPKT